VFVVNDSGQKTIKEQQIQKKKKAVASLSSKKIDELHIRKNL
jgi:hypothetical protein